MRSWKVSKKNLTVHGRSIYSATGVPPSHCNEMLTQCPYLPPSGYKKTLNYFTLESTLVAEFWYPILISQGQVLFINLPHSSKSILSNPKARLSKGELYKSKNE